MEHLIVSVLCRLILYFLVGLLLTPLFEEIVSLGHISATAGVFLNVGLPHSLGLLFNLARRTQTSSLCTFEGGEA